MRCTHCGQENQNDSSFCENCGTQLSSQQTQQPPIQNGYGEQPPVQNGYGEQPVQPNNGDFYSAPGQGYYNAPPPQYMPPPQPGYYGTPENSKSCTPALVFGILSMICGGVLWTILAIVFGIKGMKEQKERGLSTAMPLVGLILGIVGGVMWLFISILILPAYLEGLGMFIQPILP